MQVVWGGGAALHLSNAITPRLGGGGWKLVNDSTTKLCAAQYCSHRQPSLQDIRLENNFFGSIFQTGCSFIILADVCLSEKLLSTSCETRQARDYLAKGREPL